MPGQMHSVPCDVSPLSLITRQGFGVRGQRDLVHHGQRGREAQEEAHDQVRGKLLSLSFLFTQFAMFRVVSSSFGWDPNG